MAELALTVERTALAADPRVAGVEQVVYADSAERVAIASSTGLAGEYESSDCFAYLQALAEGEGGAGDRPRLRPRPRSRRPRPGGDRGRGRRPRDGDDRRLQARLALLPGRARPDRGRQLRRPDRRRPRRQRRPAWALPLRRPPRRGAGQRRRWPSTTTAATPTGSASAPFDGEGVPRRRTALIEDGRLRAFLYDTYTANREGGASTGSASRPRLPLAALGLGLEPGRRHRARSPSRSCSARPATASSSPTSPACTRASTRSPASSRSAPRGARSGPASWPSRCASSRSPATWSRCWGPSRPPARRLAGCPSGARSARRRC